MTARILNCTEEEYFADPLPAPSLSQSIANTLLQKSPRHAWLEHPRLGAVGHPSTAAKDNGSLVHTLLFGLGKEIAIIGADSFRGKDAREERDAARAAGKLPILQKDAASALGFVADLKKELERLGIRLAGESEVKVAWEEETVSGTIWCRGMLDHVIFDRGVIYDLKTCRSAHPRAVTSHIIEYGYDVQRAAYVSALRKLRPDVTGREDFVFLFAEELPEGSPVRVILHPVRLAGSFRQLGEMKWERACGSWALSLKSNSWPAYTSFDNQPTYLEAPPWAVPQELANAS